MQLDEATLTFNADVALVSMVPYAVSGAVSNLCIDLHTYMLTFNSCILGQKY